MNWSCMAAALVCPVGDAVAVAVPVAGLFVLLLTLVTMRYLLGLLTHLQGFEQ